ncbi:MAG: Gfo/Idh/MocA family oxidoreductase [Candidatus Poribacteria bacterium]|nr:Gfo/Idh/MocA family oxidoreductase [Candidatus Poribacteria bacterium]
MKRIALIGCGRISRAHLESVPELAPRAGIVALCDMNDTLRRERKEQFGIEHDFASLEDLIAWGEFDLAGVLTPPDIRRPVCLPLIDAGKHLLVEKPYAHDLAEAKEIVLAAEKAGVALAVNQNFRWMPPAPALREGILGGRLGRILSVTLNDSVWREEPRGWRSTSDKCALSIMGIHWLDRIRWITGDDPESVYTATRISGLLPTTGEDITSSVISMKSGIVATLVHLWASKTRGRNNSLQVDGADGSALATDRQIRWIDAEGKEEIETPSASFKWNDTMIGSWTELLDAVDEGRPPHHSGRDNLQSTGLLLGMYQSAATGNVVRMRDLLD